MRETLTVLAGLLVLALLAALIGPGFVDWRGYRPQFEARLSTALGVQMRIGGEIGLRLLPSPRLILGDVRVGEGTGDTSSAAIERVTVELALGALARGDLRIADAQVEGATLSVVLDEAGALRLPPRQGEGPPTQAALERVSLRRSALIWRDAGQEPVTIAPVSAEISAVSLLGPWRIEGEAAGSSLRLSTGALEPDGRLRAKASLTGEEMQVGFDGALLTGAGGSLTPGLEGGFTLSPGGAVSLTGRVAGGGRKLDLTGLALDIAGGAARLEGEGQFLPAAGTGSLALRARRLDADALIAALSERSGFQRALQALPGALDVSLDLDQMIWRAEDFSAFSLRGRLGETGLGDASASVRVAGALVGASGAVDATGIAGRLNLKAEDSRRVALALARAGLDPALADLVGGLGRIDAEAVGAWDGGRIGLERLLVTGSRGMRIEGSGDLTAERLAARLAVQGLDLNALPPGASLSGLAGSRDLALDLALTQARFRDAPPGSAALDLRREGQEWRLNRLAIDGFGGVAVSGAGALLPQGGEISGRIRAPRFETLAALAGPLLPEAMRQALARGGEGLSRLDAGFRLTRAPAGETGVTIDGAAQAGRIGFEGRLEGSGEWSRAALRLDMADRRQAFAVLGAPTPRLGGPGRLVLDHAAGRLTGSLAGQGLSVVLEQAADGAGGLTVQAEAPGQILPEGLARLMPDGVLDAHARLRFSPDGLIFEELIANLGGHSARGVLTIPREGAITGDLAMRSLDLRALLAAGLGAGAAPAGSVWSTTRFGEAAALGEMKLAIAAQSLTAADTITLRDARFVLQADRDGTAIEGLAASFGGGTVAGRVGLRREGGLAQMSGRLSLAQVDLGGLTQGALSGRLSGQVEAGGSGESPARLVAGLGGAGALSFSGASLARFDPAAYARVIAATGEDASESETDRLQRRLAEQLDAGAWALGDVAVPFTLAGGLLRLQPLVFERSGLRVEAAGTVDLRAFAADLRLSLRPLGPLPKGWPGDTPQIGVSWRGPLSAPRREADVGALSNAVAARALAREIERVEAFEADARERAAQSRRLRAERETRENERRLAEFLRIEEERRLVEERRAEEARKVEEAKRVADEIRRAAEEARQEQEARRRAEAEERARAAAARAANSNQPGPLVLPGAPREFFSEPTPQPSLPGNAAPSLPPPIPIEPVPRPLSRSPLPN